MTAAAARPGAHPVRRQLWRLLMLLAGSAAVLVVAYAAQSLATLRTNREIAELHQPAQTIGDQISSALIAARLPHGASNSFVLSPADEPGFVASVTAEFRRALALGDNLVALYRRQPGPTQDAAGRRLVRALDELRQLERRSGGDLRQLALAFVTEPLYLEIVAAQVTAQHAAAIDDLLRSQASRDRRSGVSFVCFGVLLLAGAGFVARRNLHGIDALFARERALADSLSDSERLFRTAFHSSPMGVVLAGADGAMLQVNAAFSAMLGYRVEELQRLDFFAITHADDLPRNRELLQAVIAGTLPQYRYEKRMRHRSGKFLWVVVVTAPLRDAQGRITGVISQIEDITERKRTNQDLHKALAEKEVLLKEIYHRVKNNLQVVASLLSMQGRRAADAGTRELLAESANRVKSMALVHEQLYRSQDLSNIGLAEYLAQLAAHLQEVHRPLSAQVPLRLAVDDVLLGIETAVPLGLIVNELVSNAYKHGYAADTACGQIVLRAQSLGDGRVRLSVSDDGRGLPAGFDPRASATLGMQLVVSLTEQLGATLSLAANGAAGTRVEIGLHTESPEQRRLSP